MAEQELSALEVAKLLTQVANRLTRDLRQQLRHECAEPRVTMPQMRVLHMALHHRPTLSEVAEALRVTRPTATRLVDGLVQRGWVERMSDPKDRRRIRLRTTPAGEAIQRRVQELIHTAMAERLTRLSPEAMRALYEGLLALDDVLQASEADEQA